MLNFCFWRHPLFFRCTSADPQRYWGLRIRKNPDGAGELRGAGETVLLSLFLVSTLTAQVVVINSTDNGAVSLGKINANFALLAPKANPVFTGSFTFTGLGTGALKSTSGVLGLVSGTSTHCVHVDGSSAACSSTASVSSVGLSGTANQITVTGATPITSSGAWVLSFPTNMTLQIVAVGNSRQELMPLGFQRAVRLLGQHKHTLTFAISARLAARPSLPRATQGAIPMWER